MPWFMTKFRCQSFSYFWERSIPNIAVSLRTVKWARSELGWVAKRTRYCTLISTENQEKHLEWYKAQQASGELEFENVLWTDECTIQLENHRRITFYKKGEPVQYRMRDTRSNASLEVPSYVKSCVAYPATTRLCLQKNGKSARVIPELHNFID